MNNFAKAVYLEAAYSLWKKPKGINRRSFLSCFDVPLTIGLYVAGVL